MILTLKITSLEIITQVKQELNLLSKLEVNENTTIESVVLTVGIGALRTTEYHEPAYNFLPETNLVFKLLPEEKEISITESELEQSEILMGIVDDLVFDELKRMEDQAKGFTKRTNDIDWNQFEVLINESPSLDSLYHKVKHDEEWSSNRKMALYKILLHSDRILDLDNVYDFIDNYFEIRFADLILKYPLKKEQIAKIINDPNLNPVVYSEYEERNGMLEPVEHILASKDQQIIETYYFKLIKRKSQQNINKELNAIIKSPYLSAAIIDSLLTNYYIGFLYDDILSHPNCPTKLLDKYAIVPAYGLSILKNPHVPSNIIDRMTDHILGYNQEDEFIKLVLDHPNTLESTKEKILKKQEVLKKYYNTPSIENLDLMVNGQEAKFNLNEISKYASYVRQEGKFSNDTSFFELLEDSFSEANVKMEAILNKSVAVREYSNWDPDRTSTFIHSPLADQSVCEEIYKKELTKQDHTLADETFIMKEISAKYDNLLPFSIREEVVSKLKEQAADPKIVNELADQIINNVKFLNNKFSLSAKEKQEIISSLIQNQELKPHLKDKLIKAS